MNDRRNLKRRDFSYYMRVIDDNTQQMIGHLVDISTRGLKIDSQKPLTVGKDYHLRLELTAEVADKTAMVFTARCKWCRPDTLDPFLHNSGFEIVSMTPHDTMIFQRMVDKYSSRESR
jgi:hypothetical protein